MRITAKKNDGVSPVIGTILLVAITVVLVAIISAVVMGMATDVGNAHVVGVKVTPESATSMLVTFTGGDAASVKGISIYNGSTLFNYTKLTTAPSVGVPMALTGTALASGARSISIVGVFADGNQTIWTGTLNIA